MSKHFPILLVIAMALCSSLAVNSQTKVDSSINYIHQEKASYKSKLFQSVASVFGVKKLIEKKIEKGDIGGFPTPPSKSFRKHHVVTDITIDNRQVWTIEPKGNKSNKVVLFIHGGAYVFNVSKYDWGFLETLMPKTNATYIVPDYPIGPNSTCEDTYQFMDKLYASLCTKYSSEDIIIMGASAGGGLSLGFSIKLRNDGKPQPSQIILLFPWLDVTMKNKELSEIDKKDKILGIKGLQMAGDIYSGNLDLKDYRVSPLYGKLSDLGKISVFIGTHDLCLADSRKLKRKMKEKGLTLNYFEYPKMFHGWLFVAKLKEAKAAVNQIVNIITNS